MRRLARATPVLAILLALASALPTARPARAAPPTPHSPLTSAQQHYLALAQAGVASAESHWRDARLGWYDELLSDRARYPYPGDRTASTETWFDDNGWWGLAFVNAYRATGSKRWLTDARRALGYIAAAGWDARAACTRTATSTRRRSTTSRRR